MSRNLGDRNVPAPCSVRTSFALSTLCFGLLSILTAHAAPTIPNASFETNTFANSPGYISANSAITGWIGAPTNRVGLNPAGGLNVMADNGVVPQGTRVAFIESTGGVRSTLSTTIKGLTAGSTYLVSFRTNARAGSGTARPSYRINGESPVPFGVRAVNTADTFTGAYHTVRLVFKATGTTAALEISNTSSTDSTLLVDDFTIAAGVPIQVTNVDESGPGSLREARITAGATPEFNIITFDSSLNGLTIPTTNFGAFDTTDSSGVAIDASALPNGLTINGSGARCFGVGPTTVLYLRGLTLTGGNTSGSGGAIDTVGTLLMHECTVSGNTSGNRGGAITNGGLIIATRCTFSGNQSGADGGAIRHSANAGGDFASLVQCTFQGNTAASGGALYNSAGRIFLSHCTISGNTAPTGKGAGVASEGNIAFAETVVENCIIAGNANNADVEAGWQQCEQQLH